LRYRLRAVEGVAQVGVLGGILQQYQIVTTPARLRAQDVTLEQLVEATEKANVVAGGGILEGSATESQIRVQGRSLRVEDLEKTVVRWRQPRAVLIKDVADVRFGGPVKRGDASIWLADDTPLSADGRRENGAVILIVQKQPHANTLTLTRSIERVLDQV